MARTAHGTLLSLGTVHMWGFSPSFSLLREESNQRDNDGSLNLLLLGPADVRHVLQTIASRRRQLSTQRPIHIYVYEKHIETLARHLLLLQIAFDWEIPLRQRCNLFLEVFGNALVQERTSAYIEDKAKRLIDLMHHERGFLADLIDLSHLKMKTRDELVDTFRSWFTSVEFAVEKLRDHRLRHYYEVRYDYRNNLIDWDYTMNLKKIPDASVIHIKQYKHWRNSGIAFEFGDQSYTTPNRTMAAYARAHKKHHGSVLCRGLWTDIVVSPYVALGVDCDRSHKLADQLFEIHNKGTGVEQNRHNTTEVAVFNILSFLYEIETGQTYKMKQAHDVYGGIGDSSARIEEVDEDAKRWEAESRKRAQTIVESLDGIKIIPLTGELEAHFGRRRYANLFDHVFIASEHSLVLQPPQEKEKAGLAAVLADDAVVSVESSTFLLPLKEEQRVLFAKKLVEMTSAWTSLTPLFDAFQSVETEQNDILQIKNAVLSFQFARS